MPFTQSSSTGVPPSRLLFNIMWHFEFYNLWCIKPNVKCKAANIIGGKKKKQTRFSMFVSRNTWLAIIVGIGSEGGMRVSTCVDLFVNLLTLNEPTSFPPWGGRPSWGEEIALSYKLLQEKK